MCFERLSSRNFHAFVKQDLQMRLNSLFRVCIGFRQSVAGGVATWQIWNHNTKSVVVVARFDRDGEDEIFHFSPACLRMLAHVPLGKSFFGCGTVTKPGLVACLK